MENELAINEIGAAIENHAAYKIRWQRSQRKEFKKINGFSTKSNYGGIRSEILKRDGYACVNCDMTDKQHRQKWSRPITLDHKDKNRKNNKPDNLQTLCLACHGRKDISPKIVVSEYSKLIQLVLSWREFYGWSIPKISRELCISMATVHKWLKRAGKLNDLRKTKHAN